MTSSDSGEDFESADEDFDFDESPKHHTTHKKTANSNNYDDKNKNHEKPLDKASSNVVHQLDSLKLNDESSKKHAYLEVHDSPNVEYEENENVLKAEEPDKETAIPPTKKLGTKLPVNPTTCNSYQTNKKNNSESILQNKKASDDVRMIEEIKPKQTLVFKPAEKQIEANLTSKKANPDTSGDGWEVEEEDGFEIPAPLMKMSDGSFLNKVGDDVEIIKEMKPKQKLLYTPKEKEIKTNINSQKTNPDKSGDGWEIEEEDGFEIPTALTIKSDASILNKDSDDVKIIKELKPKQKLVYKSTEKEIKANLRSKKENRDTSGDGWEVKEEDGFKIPTALAKKSDGSILCAQEQISELDQVEFRPPKTQQSQGWGNWSGWGVGSLLASATGSVSTFSSQVTAGLSTVLETTVGAPDPESLALTTMKEQNNQDGDVKTIEEAKEVEEDKTSYGGFGSIVSGVSFLGSTVINRGLDTLETLGKKTMEVLQEGDPGLMKKRAMLFPNQDKPVLSQILREAKEKADHSDKEKEEKECARKIHFESLFDDFQGMVHLEALEMLSTQCELKLQSLLLSQSGPELLDLQETMSQVRDLCELSDEEDDVEVLSREQFVKEVTKCGKSLNVITSIAKIIEVNDSVIRRISELDSESAAGVNQAAISSLAEFTAAGMECFHKSAELLLAKQLRNTADEAESYTELTSHLCARVSAIANDYTQLLTKNHPIANSSLITNIFLEASNSSSYIRNACQLLVPILQVGAVTS